MNKTIAAFARQSIKDNLSALTDEQQGIFMRMYSHKNLDRPFKEAVDDMPDDKLDWALSQTENTLKKNGIVITPVPSPAEIEALVVAGRGLDHFAWTAVSADCEESRDYLNSLVKALRAALRPFTQEMKDG